MTINKFVANASFLATALFLGDAALGENSAGTEAPIASKKLTMGIPNQWKSTTSGSQWSARFLDGRFQFRLERLGAGSCRVSIRGEAQEDRPGHYKGKGHQTIACPPGGAECQFELLYQFSLISPTRIEGEVRGPSDFDTTSCRINSSGDAKLMWVPQ